MVKRFSARRLVTDTEELKHPVVSVEDGKIVSVEEGPENGSTETLTAAFFDIHVHGARSFDFMAADPAGIAEVGRFLATRGVAHYLPTTVTAPMDLTLKALEHLADAIERPREHVSGKPVATPLGIHLEGPFVSHGKRGVHPEPSIREPSVELFDRFQAAARGHIRLMTLAPELPHALELIQHVTDAGVRVSMGHSMATTEETLAAIAVGATSSTHLFNAMRPLDHREPGIVGTILDREDVYAEAICDGVHVHPSIIRLWLKVKGEERAILVTDGMSATGVPDGTYTLGDFEVVVKDGVCLAGNTLAGSVLTMDKAVANVQKFTGTSLGAAVRLASRNPAQMMGMTELTQLTPGMPANFNVFDAAGERTGSILRGQLVE
ncbi:MAG: N-acetylglucosamine-6-phosphate deacetylase [Acidobacteriaceae bacterium]